MDNWIEWDGGKYDADPVGERRVEVKFRCGELDIDKSSHYYWRHVGDGSDIVAYRVVSSWYPF